MVFAADEQLGFSVIPKLRLHTRIAVEDGLANFFLLFGALRLVLRANGRLTFSGCVMKLDCIAPVTGIGKKPFNEIRPGESIKPYSQKN